MSQTGEHAAVPDSKPVDVVAKSLPSDVFMPGALKIIVGVVVGCLAGAGGYAYAQNLKADSRTDARAIVDAGVAAVAKDLAEHLKEDAEARAAQLRFNERMLDTLQVMENRSAGRFDALQNTILKRVEQPESAELARPASVKDGGR